MHVFTLCCPRLVLDKMLHLPCHISKKTIAGTHKSTTLYLPTLYLYVLLANANCKFHWNVLCSNVRAIDKTDKHDGWETS